MQCPACLASARPPAIGGLPWYQEPVKYGLSDKVYFASDENEAPLAGQKWIDG